MDCNVNILSSAALTPAANPTGWAAIIVAWAAIPLLDSYSQSLYDIMSVPKHYNMKIYKGCGGIALCILSQSPYTHMETKL